MEKKQEDSAILPLSSTSSSEVDIVASKIKAGEEEKRQEEEAVAAKDVDDDGYQTPTSPRHRIPPAIECPPAPKKPAIRKRTQCARTKEGTRRARRRIENESAVRRNSDDPSPTKKKAIGDVTADR